MSLVQQAATVAAEWGHMKAASVSRFRHVDARARFPLMTHDPGRWHKSVDSPQQVRFRG
jgi:hypothetical protein